MCTVPYIFHCDTRLQESIDISLSLNWLFCSNCPSGTFRFRFFDEISKKKQKWSIQLFTNITHRNFRLKVIIVKSKLMKWVIGTPFQNIASQILWLAKWSTGLELFTKEQSRGDKIWADWMDQFDLIRYEII
jgi:hypothetical protein